MIAAVSNAKQHCCSRCAYVATSGPIFREVSVDLSSTQTELIHVYTCSSAFSRLTTIATLNCDLLWRASEYRTIKPTVLQRRAQARCSSPTAARTDRRPPARVRAQLFSLPMKRVVISRRTRKHCNASTASRRAAALPVPEASRPTPHHRQRGGRTSLPRSVGLAGMPRFGMP